MKQNLFLAARAAVFAWLLAHSFGDPSKLTWWQGFLIGAGTVLAAHIPREREKSDE